MKTSRVILVLVAAAPVTLVYSYQRGPAVHVDGRSGIVVQRVVKGAIPPQAIPDGADPELELGFPVSASHTAGTFHGGPAVHTLVGNIDWDPELEILVTGLATGPLYAWNHDGSAVSGWPFSALSGASYPVLGQFSRLATSSGAIGRLEVFSGHIGFPGKMAAIFGSGFMLLGWPQNSANFVSNPAAAADVNRDGVEEVFLNEEDGKLHGYRANGTILPGWPVHQGLGSQRWSTPAVADLDGAGDLELITATSPAGGAHLLAFYSIGVLMSGFPRAIQSPYADTYPVVGDVDGDGALEILTARANPARPYNTQVDVRSANGAVERVLTASRGVPYGTTPALADLDGDGFPEIIVQTEGALDVWKGDGSVFPGWPRVFSMYAWTGQGTPVIGDVTGDGQPDIVILHGIGGDAPGEVRVYDRHGNLHPSFPKLLPIGSGATPAIADIDLDGRNEIIVNGSFWNGFSGMYPKVWAYDLGGGTHGAVEWGQFMGGPRHQGRYGQPVD